MKGLLYKDLYMTWKYFKSYLLLIVVFLAASWFQEDNLFFVFYPVIFSGTLILSLISWDERDKWNVYCGALPVSRAQLVSAKYLVGLLLQAAVLALTGAVQGSRMLIQGGFNGGEFFQIMGILVVLGAFTPGVLLPFVFKLGVEKGRIAYLVVLGVVCGAIPVLTFTGFTRQPADPQGGFQIAVGLLALGALVLYGISWLLSIRFYEKRDL